MELQVTKLLVLQVVLQIVINHLTLYQNDKLNKFVSENMDELAMDISAGQGKTFNYCCKTYECRRYKSIFF